MATLHQAPGRIVFYSYSFGNCVRPGPSQIGRRLLWRFYYLRFCFVVVLLHGETSLPVEFSRLTCVAPFCVSHIRSIRFCAVRILGTSNRIGFRAPQIIRFVIGGRGSRMAFQKTIVWGPRAGIICVCLVFNSQNLYPTKHNMYYSHTWC